MQQDMNLERLLLPSVPELLRNAELVGDLEFLYATLSSPNHINVDMSEVKMLYMQSLRTKYSDEYKFENTSPFESAYNSLIKGRRNLEQVNN